MLDEAARKGGVSRGKAFEDFLEIVVCTLSGGAMEERYLQLVQPYAQGEKGKRAIDTIANLFGELVRIMEETRADILGDLFEGAITYGEAGQFLTPESLTDLMAQLTGSDGHTVNDPCCGSGRMLLAAAKLNPHREFIGQDIDVRCVRITAINLGLHNLYGHVIWGNTLLPSEQRLVYRTGFNGRGVIQEVTPPAEAPASLPAAHEEAAQGETPAAEDTPQDEESTPAPLPEKLTQRSLFDEEQP